MTPQLPMLMLTTAILTFPYTRQIVAQESLPHECLRQFAPSVSRPPRVKALTREALNEAVERRVCLTTFPWPSDVFPLESQHPDVENLNSARAIEIRRQIRAALNAPDPLSVSGIDELTAIRVLYRKAKDVDHVQLLRYADFWVVRMLYKEGRYNEVTREVESLLPRQNQQLAGARLDEAEERTYFRTATLEALLHLYRLAADVRGAPAGSRRLLAAEVQYLNSRNRFQTVFPLSGIQELDLLDRLNSFKATLIGSPEWQRRSLRERLPELAGFAEEGDRILLLLRGKSLFAAELRNGVSGARILGLEPA